MTGAVASKKVTEAYKGRLKSYRNGLLACNGISRLDCEWYITSSPTRKATESPSKPARAEWDRCESRS